MTARDIEAFLIFCVIQPALLLMGFAVFLRCMYEFFVG
jgi:hypothetical protein